MLNQPGVPQHLYWHTLALKISNMRGDYNVFLSKDTETTWRLSYPSTDASDTLDVIDAVNQVPVGVYGSSLQTSGGLVPFAIRKVTDDKGDYLDGSYLYYSSNEPVRLSGSYWVTRRYPYENVTVTSHKVVQIF